ncbi:IS3 family transposase, partial [Burkholderia ambifaria]|uniref:IS3 family transposase n=1 Tax=Burkholderia ambifaria TaxID=152480 RepID=UPI001FC8941D
RVLFVISSVPLPALSLAQAPAKPLIRLSKFARPPLFATREQARLAITEYIEIFYNRQRTQARLNYQSPV